MTDEPPEPPLPPTQLAAQVRATSERARAQGALVPLDTEVRLVPDSGLTFVVRVSANVARKQAAAPGEAPEVDPFSPPYESDLYVGEVSRTHTALLNKFNVLEDHVLLITRHWAEQQEMLDVADFEALLLGLAGMDGLAFYNGGSEAGASQPHKHLQLVPLPLATTGPALPFAEWLERPELDGGIGHIPDLPFRHAVAPIPEGWLDEPGHHAPEAWAVAQALWRSLGYDPRGRFQPVPYNLLATRRWMWLVPRRQERCEGLAVNALGFAGALLAPNEDAFDRLCEIGPMNLLQATASPPGPDAAPG